MACREVIALGHNLIHTICGELISKKRARLKIGQAAYIPYESSTWHAYGELGHIVVHTKCA